VKKIAIAAAAAVVTSVPVFALFGFGDIVFDPSSYGELVAEVSQLAQQYSQLVKTYQMVTNQYNQMVTNATMITSKARWRALVSPWSLPSATNTYGTTAGWISVLKTGSGALGGYQSSVTPLHTYSPVWSSMNSTQQDSISRHYSTVELSDGVTVNGLQQLGEIRGNSAEVEAAIDSLESDSLSDDDDLNTEVGVLNKVNAASIISVRNSQDTNKLLGAVLDQQMVVAKAQRDAQAESINNDIALRQNAPAIDSQHLSGATSVLTTYRLP
jgi:conjugal transfer/entry exclusion protein